MPAPLRCAEPRKDGVTDAIASPSKTPCRADAGDHLVFVNGPFYFDDLSGIACHVRERRLVWLNIRSHADKVASASTYGFAREGASAAGQSASARSTCAVMLATPFWVSALNRNGTAPESLLP